MGSVLSSVSCLVNDTNVLSRILTKSVAYEPSLQHVLDAV